MSFDARQIANWFIVRAKQDDRTLSIMSLLKLVYFAHAWHLEINKAPLFSNSIEAWQYGPVVPEVYSAFRSQGVSVGMPLPTVPAIDDQPTLDLLEQVYARYARLSPFRLSELTHEAGGPWEIARQLKGWYADIPNDLIQSHFEKKRLEAERAQ